jgi:hypothetical protein
MFKRIAITISAAALVMLAIALAPAVPTALATARTTTTTKDDATLKQPLADQPCAAFEAWFLDPACGKARTKKAARTKHHLAHNVR